MTGKYSTSSACLAASASAFAAAAVLRLKKQLLMNKNFSYTGDMFHVFQAFNDEDFSIQTEVLHFFVVDDDAVHIYTMKICDECTDAVVIV